jgi:hypothetical protein
MESSKKNILDTLQHIEDEIASTLNDLSSIKQEMEVKLSEENTRVFKFIFNLQRCGFSQGFNVEESIQKHFGFSKEKSEKFMFNYIEQLSEMNEKFGGNIAVSMSNNTSLSDISESSSHVSDSQQKKKKGPKPYSEMTPEELAIAKAKRLEKSIQSSSQNNVSVIEPNSKPTKRVVKVKKTSDGIKIWNSFIKIVKTEMEANGEQFTYDDIIKRAKEMKEADKSAYELFSATWTPDDNSLSNV